MHERGRVDHAALALATLLGLGGRRLGRRKERACRALLLIVIVVRRRRRDRLAVGAGLAGGAESYDTIGKCVAGEGCFDVAEVGRADGGGDGPEQVGAAAELGGARIVRADRVRRRAALRRRPVYGLVAPRGSGLLQGLLVVGVVDRQLIKVQAHVCGSRRERDRYHVVVFVGGREEGANVVRVANLPIESLELRLGAPQYRCDLWVGGGRVARRPGAHARKRTGCLVTAHWLGHDDGGRRVVARLRGRFGDDENAVVLLEQQRHMILPSGLVVALDVENHRQDLCLCVANVGCEHLSRVVGPQE